MERGRRDIDATGVDWIARSRRATTAITGTLTARCARRAAARRPSAPAARGLPRSFRDRPCPRPRRGSTRAAQAASKGGMPWASRPAMSPARTSPVPAVASQGGALALIAARPSGAAITVSGPLNTTTAPDLRAAARASSVFASPPGRSRRAERSAEQPMELAGMGGEHRAPVGGERRKQRVADARPAAKLVRPSASMTAARSPPSTASTISRVAAPTPAPGPIATALKRRSASSISSSGASSTGRTITASSAVALTASASRGEAMVTRPAPARSAAIAARRAAPVWEAPPDTTTAWPRPYLCPAMSGTGNRLAPQGRGSSRTSSGRSRPGPRP